MKKEDYVQHDAPLIPASQNLPELTLKVIILSIFLAIFLAASNAYLALKIGTTISASIPASVLAISILRFFKNSNVLESNIIQTAASGGEGVAGALAFILPAMILLHLWQGFPYWEVALITAFGGVLGVLCSVPLRRIMLYLPALRFPEGTAIGNVLKISSKPGQGLKLLLQGGIAGGVINFAQTGLQVCGNALQFWGSSGAVVFGMGIGLSPAPLAAGYIVGGSAGVSFLVGLVGGWLILLPIVASHLGHVPTGSAYVYAMQLWSTQLRFVGVGVMLVGGVWTLFRLLAPVITGIRDSFQSAKALKASTAIEKSLRTERDMPFLWVLVLGGIIAVCLFFLTWHFVKEAGFFYGTTHMALIAFFSTLFILLVGFILSMICGYFTGLVGSTNNPISGILIIGLIALGVLYLLLIPAHQGEGVGHVAGLMILITTIVGTVATISNENLQDLKAGLIVGATPWKQQLILIIGVVSSALVVGPILEMLFRAYGIGGVFPHPGMDPSHMLAAPQAGLMAAIAKGMRTHNLPWGMIEIGAGFAVLVIIADIILKRFNMGVPVLGVGLGVYLPPQITTPIIIGALLSHLVKKIRIKRHGKKPGSEHHQGGILLACGLVAGAALMGVILAIPFMLMGSSDALAIVPASFGSIANFLGFVALFALCVWLYKIGIKPS